MELSPAIVKAVKNMGFQEASPIQEKAIPEIMKDSDIVGQEQTGTGKTAAYGIPMLEKIDIRVRKTQGIILCPTRELAIQVTGELRNLAKYMSGIKIVPIFGGQEIIKQIRALKGGAQIVVGTPGRVMDHMRRRTLKLDAVRMAVLDEADEMLNMGFREDIETILGGAPKERQTVLFSATMPKPILEITKKFQHDAKIIKVVRKELTVANIEQLYYEVKPKRREEALTKLLDFYTPKLSIVFCNTKRQVDTLTDSLRKRGYEAQGLHGDMKQAQRNRVMKGFRTGKADILSLIHIFGNHLDCYFFKRMFDDKFFKADSQKGLCYFTFALHPNAPQFIKSQYII